MFNLSAGSLVFVPFVVIGLISLFTFVAAAAVMVTLISNKKRKTEERLQRVSEIDYTQIIGSGGGSYGGVTTFGSAGMNTGSYSSAPVTKFLVVYLNGRQEIVTVNDNSALCKEYLSKLKKD